MPEGILNDKPRLNYVVGEVEDKFNDLSEDEIITLAQILTRLDRIATDKDGNPIWNEAEMDVIAQFQDLEGTEIQEDVEPESDDEADSDSDDEHSQPAGYAV